LLKIKESNVVTFTVHDSQMKTTYPSDNPLLQVQRHFVFRQKCGRESWIAVITTSS